MSFFSSSSSSDNSPAASTSSASSAETKAAIIQQLQSEQALSNARTLIQACQFPQSITENCYEKCIPTPGSNLSSREQTCLNQCMEKYISLWNATSKAYISRAGREKPAIQGIGAPDSF